ncbi:hypothetical protein GF378_01860 [Candidatus Pacearchaeota archaeon]|nr:hypothetical protein [Candidatus Pacearchaeota archaeon]
MTEKETIFSSSLKYQGIWNFSDLYQFAYDWLVEEFDLWLTEGKYVEKLKGDSKNVDIEWEGVRKVTDYFMYQVKIKFRIIALQKVEVERNGIKEKTNKGSVKISVKGVLQRDYQGKFESGAIRKFMRSLYEKWIIPSRIEDYEEKLADKCDEFLAQVKAYLDLEGKR